MPAPRLRYFVIFLFAWTALGLLHASLTELTDDEAYYWIYSKHLDWGYFDHPPMISWMIKAGTSIFPGELGVRFFSLIFSALTIIVIEKLTKPQNQIVFFGICSSVFVFNLFSFTCFPDIPLLFFSACFFLVYKQFLQKNTLKHAVLLGIVIALMMYSKHHAILVVLFTLVTNLKLLKNPKFYLITVISILLYLPHILWQIQNNYPTLEYHLIDRSPFPYTYEYTLNYVFGQFIFYGPLIGLVLIPVALVYKASSQIEKALKWNAILFLLFFFFMSFKGRAEPNWTIIIVTPLIYFGYQWISNRKNKKLWAGLLLFMMVPTVLLRIQFHYPLLNDKGERTDEMRGWREFGEMMKTKTGKTPLFASNYQIASKLSFYTGKDVLAINVNGRKNQFSVWNKNLLKYIGKPAYIIGYKIKSQDTVISPKGSRMQVLKVDKLSYYGDILLKCEEGDIECAPGENKFLQLNIDLTQRITTENYDSVYASILLTDDSRNVKVHIWHIRNTYLNPLLNGDSLNVDMNFFAPNEPGTYKLVLALYTERYGFWENIVRRDVIVKD